jgi:acyl-CoA thioesterase YciA
MFLSRLDSILIGEKSLILSCQTKIMRFHTRKWVKPEDLNPNQTLFGGKLLSWIDEEAALYAIIQLENERVVTKHMSEINFISSAKQGDIVEIGIDVVKFGKTSLTLKCEVRNIMTKETIITVNSITMVNLDSFGRPSIHGKTAIEFVRDRIKK